MLKTFSVAFERGFAVVELKQAKFIQQTKPYVCFFIYLFILQIYICINRNLEKFLSNTKHPTNKPTVISFLQFEGDSRNKKESLIKKTSKIMQDFHIFENRIKY